MAETIICPKCGCDVTEVLSVQLKAQIRQDVALEWRDREAELAQQQAALKSERESLASEKLAIEQEIVRRLGDARKRLKAKAWKKAREAMSAELRSTQAELNDAKTRLQQSKDAELQLRRDRQKLEDEKQNLELAVARQLDTERAAIRDSARKQADEEQRLKVAEYEKTIADMRRELDAARRIADQGSQQLQGEVLELDLEELLRQQFPCDEIRPVPKGVCGADVIQVVRDATLAECGAILWESKRTINWSNTWLPKLRDDKRAANACIAILVTEKLHPKMASTFESVEGIWVTNRACCMSLATALRSGIMDVAEVRRALQGQGGKMEALYEYLSSPEFQNRISGIAEAFVTMQKDLVKEKAALAASWAKREQQILRALKSTSGMYGDIRGIVGGSLPVVESLEFPRLTAPNGEREPEEAALGLFAR